MWVGDMGKYPKHPPTWTNGEAPPLHYVDWWDWLYSTVRAVAETAVERATERQYTIETTNQRVRLYVEDGLREIDGQQLRRTTARYVRQSMENHLVSSVVDRQLAAEQIYNRACDWLLRRGYTIS